MEDLLKPVKPLDSDCCGSGCRTCVFDVYEEELQIWEKKLIAVQEGIVNQTDCEAMSVDNYTVCHIVEVTKTACSDVFLFTFKLPTKTTLSFHAGQHVIIQETWSRHGTISRPYTIISQPGTVTQFQLLIKTYERGQMSSIIRQKWLGHGEVSVACRGPFGTLNYQANRYRHVVLIAAGTGVTPLFQLSRLITGNEDDETRITLLFCCRNYSEILLRDEMQWMQSFWNFNVRYFLSDDRDRNAEKMRKHNERIAYDALTKELLYDEMTDLLKAECCVYLCGPKKFEKDISSYLIDFGLDSSRIRTF